VLVEDAWQHRGIGTQLTASLLDSARAKGVSIVHADVLSDDRHILQAQPGSSDAGREPEGAGGADDDAHLGHTIPPALGFGGSIR
jgi:GNAT superfamily N-acetyltransferase